jgi:hypothetical protein
MKRVPSLALIGLFVAPAFVHAHGGDASVIHTCVQQKTQHLVVPAHPDRPFRPILIAHSVPA